MALSHDTELHIASTTSTAHLNNHHISDTECISSPLLVAALLSPGREHGLLLVPVALVLVLVLEAGVGVGGGRGAEAAAGEGPAETGDWKWKGTNQALS